MANVKTITLGGTEQKVIISGQNCDIRNDGADTIYASAQPNITAGADGVLAIPVGQAAKLLDTKGTVYLKGTGVVQICGSDYSELVFKCAATSSGEGGEVTKTYVDNSDKTTLQLAKQFAEENFSNPNLLDNSWFGKGVINQRGKTEYSGARVYCIDRWRIGSSTTIGNCTLTDDGINFVTTDETCDFEQTLENYNMIVGKLCTISYGDNLGDVYSLTFTMGEYCRETLGKLVFYSTSDRHIMFRCPANENASMKWAKLELGSVATPFIPLNPAAELAKCQRYYYQSWSGDIDTKGIITSAAMSNASLQNVEFPVTMRTTPTVTFYTSSGIANAVRDWNAGTDVTGVIAAYANERSVVPTSPESTGFTEGKYYGFHYSASAEL